MTKYIFAIGAIAGEIWLHTAIFEDGNLLVSTVVALFSGFAAVLSYKILRVLYNFVRNFYIKND